MVAGMGLPHVLPMWEDSPSVSMIGAMLLTVEARKGCSRKLPGWHVDQVNSGACQSAGRIHEWTKLAAPFLQPWPCFAPAL